MGLSSGPWTLEAKRQALVLGGKAATGSFSAYRGWGWDMKNAARAVQGQVPTPGYPPP